MVIQAPILHGNNCLATAHEHDDLCGCDKFHLMHPEDFRHFYEKVKSRPFKDDQIEMMRTEMCIRDRFYTMLNYIICSITKIFYSTSDCLLQGRRES